MAYQITGSTGELCQVSGTYRSQNCNPVVDARFQRGDQFTPCQNGGATTWVLIRRD